MVILPRIIYGATLFAGRPILGMGSGDFLTGMLLTAAFPATFWCAVLKLADVVFHLGLTWQVFMAMALAITCFLSGIYACIVRNA